jgi:hypothetical protein
MTLAVTSHMPSYATVQAPRGAFPQRVDNLNSTPLALDSFFSRTDSALYAYPKQNNPIAPHSDVFTSVTSITSDVTKVPVWSQTLYGSGGINAAGRTMSEASRRDATRHNPFRLESHPPQKPSPSSSPDTLEEQKNYVPVTALQVSAPLLELRTQSEHATSKRENTKTLFHFDLPVSGILVAYLTRYYHLNHHPTLNTCRQVGQLLAKGQKLQKLVPKTLQEADASLSSPIRYDLLASPEALYDKNKSIRRTLLHQADTLFKDRPALLQAYKELIASHANQIAASSKEEQQRQARKGIHQLPGKLLTHELPQTWEPNKSLKLAYTQAAESLEHNRKATWQTLHEALEKTLQVQAEHTHYAKAWHALNKERQGMLNLMESDAPQAQGFKLGFSPKLYPFKQYAKELGLSPDTYSKQAAWRPMVALHQFLADSHKSMAQKLHQAGQIQHLGTRWAGFAETFRLSQKRAVQFANVESWIMGVATVGMITLERRVHQASERRDQAQA